MNWYKKINKAGMKLFLSLILSASIYNCTPENIPVPPTPTPTVATVNEIDFWLTKGDQSVKLEKTSYYFKIR